MKITFFRLLSFILLTVSLSAGRCGAEVSVCCPVSTSECGIPDAIPTMPLVGMSVESSECSTDTWLDRVSSTLKTSDSQRTQTPFKAHPESAAPMELDVFQMSTFRSSGATALARTDKETVVKESVQIPLRHREVLILREAQTAVPVVESVDNELPKSELTSNELTKSEPINLEASIAAVISLANQSRSIADSYWQAGSELDLTGLLQAKFIKVMDWTSIQIQQQVENDSEAELAERREKAEVLTAMIEATNRFDARRFGYTHYDVYDAGIEYLYGCFGYESIYGFEQADLEPVAEQAAPSGQLVDATTTQQLKLKTPADFDGYLPYDMDEQIAVIETSQTPSEIVAPTQAEKTTCPIEQQLANQSANLLKNLVSKVNSMPSHTVGQIKQYQQELNGWIAKEDLVRWHHRIETVLCGTKALDVYFEALSEYRNSLKPATATQAENALHQVDEKEFSVQETMEWMFQRMHLAIKSVHEKADHYIGRKPSSSKSR
jgi:hypothetical protein